MPVFFGLTPAAGRLLGRTNCVFDGSSADNATGPVRQYSRSLLRHYLAVTYLLARATSVTAMPILGSPMPTCARRMRRSVLGTLSL